MSKITLIPNELQLLKNFLEMQNYGGKVLATLFRFSLKAEPTSKNVHDINEISYLFFS